ncbi:TPA: hypothetical protein DCZ39_00895 [Patescibacteria group bacterium]|nr:hypothetical protein [Candidatus Gracilibacteria bacterium]
MDHPFYDTIISPVGIQFDEESHIFYLLGKVIQIRSYGRFSTADTDTIEESFPAFQKIEKHLFRDEIVLEQHHLFWQDTFRIVTEMAAEIASLSKDYTGDFAGIVDHRRLLYSRKFH